MTTVVREGQLFVANAGDCRAVLCRAGAAEPLSCDHRASRRDEQERIERLVGACHVGVVTNHPCSMLHAACCKLMTHQPWSGLFAMLPL